MKSLITLFLVTFIFIWGFNLAINYLQQRHRSMINMKVDYKDFSPQQIEADRKQSMDNYRQQARDFKAQQASQKSQQDAQKRFMEDQKRQMRDMQRMNKAR